MTAIHHSADYSEPAPRAFAPGLAYAALPGRLLMSAIFILSGITKLTHLSGMASMVHMNPGLLAVAGAVELVGGAMLLLGLWPRLGALALFLFLIPTTLMFHNFWAAPPEHYQEQQINFLKNLAIMGGLLMVLAYGSGPLSVLPERRTRTTG
ncbi:MAG TPA: DoxX family protein [Tepidisphaeraceae bacterium]|jgi:putative oxidoreductase